MARTLRLKLEGEYYRWSKFHVEDWTIRVPGERGGGKDISPSFQSTRSIRFNGLQFAHAAASRAY
jgi:hypothetical protein